MASEHQPLARHPAGQAPIADYLHRVNLSLPQADTSSLNQEQKEVFMMVMNGQGVFITGGAGKLHLT
jgi:hypothetical protein